jgi:hypothetical protein
MIFPGLKGVDDADVKEWERRLEAAVDGAGLVLFDKPCPLSALATLSRIVLALVELEAARTQGTDKGLERK